jgi:hypothetical protein
MLLEAGAKTIWNFSSRSPSTLPMTFSSGVLLRPSFGAA